MNTILKTGHRAPPGNQYARKHGRFDHEARERTQALCRFYRECQALLQRMDETRRVSTV